MLLLTPVIEDATLEAIIQRIDPAPAGQQWNLLTTLVDILHDENAKLGLKQKVFMTTIRHALTGMKVCGFGFFPLVPRFTLTLLIALCIIYLLMQKGPSTPEIMRVLGRGRTLTRLKAAQTKQ